MRSLCTKSKSNLYSLQLEKGHLQQQRSSAAKNTQINFLKRKIKLKERVQKEEIVP